MISYLVENITLNQVFLNETVEKINWDKKNIHVSVTTNNGVYYAEQVILTSSLNYLKQNHLTLFEPSLPDYKIKALNNLGYASLNNIFLVFSSKTFTLYNNFKFIWREDLDFPLNSISNWNLTVTYFLVVRLD